MSKNILSQWLKAEWPKEIKPLGVFIEKSIAIGCDLIKVSTYEQIGSIWQHITIHIILNKICYKNNFSVKSILSQDFEIKQIDLVTKLLTFMNTVDEVKMNEFNNYSCHGIGKLSLE